MQANFCHCGSDSRFQDCCGRFISAQALPETPEQLMRSRYSAFCTGDIDYLIATHHPSQRQQNDRETLQETVNTTQWLSLRIVASRTLMKTKGEVEFVAYYGEKPSEQIHERSRFSKENGRWFYLDGKLLAPSPPGRNEACWCGSRRKYKQCHGA